jgi:hypothetical protein
VSRYPASAPIHDFVLLFLPPGGPHLTPLATGSLKPSLLVSPLLGGLVRHRPFALALHLHQRKSSRNLHIQYSAKSQSTPRCQSLIEPGATIHRSSDALVLSNRISLRTPDPPGYNSWFTTNGCLHLYLNVGDYIRVQRLSLPRPTPRQTVGYMTIER